MLLPRPSLVENDTGSKYRVRCRDDDTKRPIDLTGCTVSLRWQNKERTQTISRPMTIIAPASDGVAEYQFAAGELYAPKMFFEVRIIDGAGDVLDNLELLEEFVRPAMPTLP